MLHHLGRITRTTIVLAGLWAVAPLASSPVAGQDRPAEQSDARLQGVVVDQTTYQAVNSASVSLEGIEGVATTGRWGAFAFPDAPLGTISMRVSAPGHVSVVQLVEVSGDRVAFVQVVLPSVAATLAEVFVQVRPPEDSTVEAAQTAMDLLSIEVPRIRINSSAVGKSDYTLSLRPGTTVVGSVEPLILIDGVVMAGGLAYEALLGIPARDVEDIEVLTGVAAALYPLAANGVILVGTVRGR